MKISYNWLKEYVEVKEAPERIAEILTSGGLEVEAIEEVAAVKGGLKGVVVGEVMECIQHPDADRLHVTKVDVGSGELLQIVCGAPNVAAGQKVAVATIGTTLYFTNGEEVKIKRSKLRGVESQGMICAEDELSLGTDHEGIMVLDPNAKNGTPAAVYFGLENDMVFEIGLTPNRVDAASHLGVARDLAASLSVDLKRPFVEDFDTVPGSEVGIMIENTEACPRYTGITIRDITVKPSPDWLQKRLLSIGLRPINNVVDVTNFVLHELGHPLHAFDADKIDGQQIIIRTCKEGDTFTTLDGVNRTLSASDLMICSTKRPMCIAGVFGGLDSGVTEETKNIFLESAYFNPVWIRKTARRHGLKTDASFRFERGADPNITPYALIRAALLIQEVAGGSIIGSIADIYPNPVEPCRVHLNYQRMARLIGKDIEHQVIKNILLALEYNIESETAEGATVSVPTYRVDVTRECDVVEDLLRIYGYNNVEIPTKINVAVNHVQKPNKEKAQNTISDFMTSNGFYEIMGNSLTSAGYYDGLQAFPSDHLVRILNPLSSDLNAMRQTLLFNGMEALAYNINRQQTDLKLYEYGNCYFYTPEKNDGTLKAYSEAPRMAIFTTGDTSPQSWNLSSRPSSFFYLKGFLEKILGYFDIDIHTLEVIDAPGDLFSDGITYMLRGKLLANIGLVNEKISKRFDIKQDVYATEISWNLLLKAAKSHKVEFSELPKFPEVRRDLALVIDENVAFAQLRAIAFNTEKKILKRVTLFDVYRGDKLPEGKKQYALSFQLQDFEETLTDERIERIMRNLLTSFVKEVGADLRR